MASQQWRRRGLPQPNRNCDAAGKSNANGNDHTASISYADGDDATSDAHTIGDPASTDTEATTNAVPSSDAVNQWAKG